jgi:hypothetical protein
MTPPKLLYVVTEDWYFVSHRLPLAEVMALWRLYRRERPDLVHHVALKSVMFGALAAWLARVPAQVNAVAGLGWLFTSSGRAVRLLRPVLRWMLARLLNQPHSLTIVQNPGDKALLERSGVSAARCG